MGGEDPRRARGLTMSGIRMSLLFFACAALCGIACAGAANAGVSRPFVDPGHPGSPDWTRRGRDVGSEAFPAPATAYDRSKLVPERLGRGVVAWRDSTNTVCVGWRYLSCDPVRQSLLNNSSTKEQARQQLGLKGDLPTILVIGGSLGARTINDAIAAGIGRFEERQIQVIWQTGKIYIDECERKAREANAQYVHPQAFISDMAMAYKAADIVISRAGASSISELCLLGKAAILVPSPNVAEDHQTKNARALSDKGAAVFVADNEARQLLVEQAVALVSATETIRQLETEVKKLALPDSADIIADEVLKLAIC